MKLRLRQQTIGHLWWKRTVLVVQVEKKVKDHYYFSGWVDRWFDLEIEDVTAGKLEFKDEHD